MIIINYFLLCLLSIFSVSTVFSQEKERLIAETLCRELNNIELIKEMKQELKWRNARGLYLMQELFDNGGYVETVDELPVYYPNHRTYIEGRQKNYDILLRKFLWAYNERQVPWDDLDTSDFMKLAWVIKTNKTSYQPGEPIGISVSLQNTSTEEVKILNVYPMPAFFLNSMKIIHREGWRSLLLLDFKDAPLTKEGIRFYKGGSFYDRGRNLSAKSISLKPNDLTEVSLFFKTLNQYYDLSIADEYELTFYTRNFLGSDEEQIGEYPKPCTIHFKIEGFGNWLDDKVIWRDSEVNSPKEPEQP